MGQTTSAGAKLYIGTTTAATNQTQFEADTYTEIGELRTLGAFGKQYQIIETNSLNQRKTDMVKGSYSYGRITPELHWDEDDTGQTALLTALDDDSKYNFKVVFNNTPSSGSTPTPTIRYFRGVVAQYQEVLNDVNSVIGCQTEIGITELVRVAKTSS
jgi:hypothetical protein